MEKYGVLEEDDKSKTAAEKSKKPRCTTCGKELRPQSVTGILLCPQCGSLPFEGV
jgi:predicted RNA-binding Zn-ribbon protein involved in translation (DUF1610 family)